MARLLFRIGFLFLWAIGVPIAGFAQDSLNLAVHPELLLHPQFDAANCRLGDYYLGDDVFNVVYDPIVSTSFQYMDAPLAEQIRQVETQGGTFWMEDGTGLFIRNGQIAEFRFNPAFANHLGWKPGMWEDAGWVLDEKRPERMLENGPVDSYLHFYNAAKLRVRVSPDGSRILQIAVGCTSKDPVWD